MKHIIFITVSAMALVACGSGGKKQAMISACVDQGGNSQANCTCIADTAENMLDSGLFAKLADSTASGEGMQALMNDLNPGEESQFMSFALSVGNKCSGTL
ncbi:MAG: hypothetical protein AAFZ74_12380 [Pseudomonadota bacterium]